MLGKKSPEQIAKLHSSAQKIFRSFMEETGQIFSEKYAGNFERASTNPDAHQLAVQRIISAFRDIEIIWQDWKKIIASQKREK
ncbi:MAG: hypothetical protein V1494_07685 [Candidatus Diapherotrites archaeon]